MSEGLKLVEKDIKEILDLVKHLSEEEKKRTWRIQEIDTVLLFRLFTCNL